MEKVELDLKKIQIEVPEMQNGIEILQVHDFL